MTSAISATADVLTSRPAERERPAAEPLEATISACLGPDFSVAVAAPELMDDVLFPEERHYIARAVPKRRAEFGTARVCARRALAQLGVAPVALVPHPDRSPHWPARVVGSISHTNDLCAVAITNSPEIVGFGLDIEDDTALPPETEPSICTAAELLWLVQQPSGDRDWLGKLIFCAKEAFYKCQYPTTQTFLDFQDVVLQFDFTHNTFRVERITHEGACWTEVQRARGKYLRQQGVIVAAATLLRPDNVAE